MPYILLHNEEKKESQHICVTSGSTFHFPHSFGIKYCCGHEYQLWNFFTMTIPEKEGLVPLNFENYKHFENYHFPLLNFIDDLQMLWWEVYGEHENTKLLYAV